MKQEMMVWQWHQLDYMQISWTSLQTHLYTFILDASTSLWSPYVIRQTIIFSSCFFFMVALCNRADHYIFIL